MSKPEVTGAAPALPGRDGQAVNGGLAGAGGGSASGPGGGGSGPVFVNVYVQGSVIQSDRQLVDTLSEAFASDGRRNNSTYPAFAT